MCRLHLSPLCLRLPHLLPLSPQRHQWLLLPQRHQWLLSPQRHQWLLLLQHQHLKHQLKMLRFRRRVWVGDIDP